MTVQPPLKMIRSALPAVVTATCLGLAGAAAAQTCSPGLYNLQNGQTADASQLMYNFNCVLASPRFAGPLGVGVPNPAFQLDVQGGAALGGTTFNIGSNPSSFLAGLQNTGRLGIAWNISSGRGETDFISNRVVNNGGFEFYDYQNDGALHRLVQIDGISGGDLNATGRISSNGYQSRAGMDGNFGYHWFNFNWTGAGLDVWVDHTNIGTLNFSSDQRLKKNISPDKSSGIRRIMALRPVTFQWNDVEIYKNDGKTHEGLIAQELQKVIPSAVNHLPNEKDERGKDLYETINPMEIVPVLVKALQEQQAEIDRLKAQIRSRR